MVSLPKNLSDDVIDYCMGCRNNDEVMTRLENNLDFLIPFFESASKDETWCQQCPMLVERLTQFLDVQSVDRGLTLGQARHVNDVARSRFIPQNPLGQNTIKIKLLDPATKEPLIDPETKKPVADIQMNKLLLMASSVVFKNLLGGFNEGKLNEIEFRYLRPQDILLIKEFVETGKITDTRSIGNVDLEQIIRAADLLEIPGLVAAVCQNTVSPQNILSRLDLAYQLKNPQLRDACLKLLNKDFRGLKLSAQGFNDLKIDINRYQIGDLKKMAPILGFFNPSASPEENRFPNCPTECQLTLNLNPNVLDKDPGKALEQIREISTELNWVSYLDFSHSGANITDELMDALTTQCHDLISVDLSKCGRITDRTAEYLSSRCKSLDTLNLASVGGITSPGFRLLANGCPELTTLKVEHNHQLTNEDLQEFASKCEKLSNIDVKICNQISQAGVEALAAAKKLKTLSLAPDEDRMLEINENAIITDANLISLAQRNPQLTEITLMRYLPAVTPAGLQTLAATCPHLRKIFFENIQGLNDAVATSMGNLRELEHLEIFRLGTITDAGLANIARCSELRTLRLMPENGSLSDAAVATIVAGCRKLTKIRFNSSGGIASKTQLEAIARNLEELEELDLSNYAKNYQDENYVDLSPLKNLKHIALKSGIMTDKQISRVLHGCSSVTSLDLTSFDNATPEKMAAIAKACPNLQSVDLSYVNINDEALLSLARGCPNLANIKLSRSSVTPAVLEAVAAFCPNMESIDLGDIKLDRKELSNLPLRFPLLKELRFNKSENLI